MTEHTIEEVLIAVKRYKTKEGMSVCGLNFNKGETCMFLMSRRFGTEYTCMFCEDNYRGDTLSLEITDKDKKGDNLGWIVPCKTCPLWKNK
jgi:hypothetical protein